MEMDDEKRKTRNKSALERKKRHKAKSLTVLQIKRIENWTEKKLPLLDHANFERKVHKGQQEIMRGGYVKYTLERPHVWWCWQCKHQTGAKQVYVRYEGSVNDLFCSPCYAKAVELEVVKEKRLAQIKAMLIQKKAAEQKEAERKLKQEENGKAQREFLAKRAQEKEQAKAQELERAKKAHGKSTKETVGNAQNGKGGDAKRRKTTPKHEEEGASKAPAKANTSTSTPSKAKSNPKQTEKTTTSEASTLPTTKDTTQKSLLPKTAKRKLRE